MTYLPNTFRSRLAEQQRDDTQFVRTFGPGMLDVLPRREVAWNRLVVLRSAPGAGKTSLLRMLTPKPLQIVTAKPDDYRSLHAHLSDLGAIDDRTPLIVGVLVGLGKDYKALLDLGPENGSSKVFFRLLDARICVRYVEALCAATGNRPDEIVLGLDQGRGSEAGAHLFSSQAAVDVSGLQPSLDDQEFTAQQLLAAARHHERQVLSLMDSLVPVNWSMESGHATLYSLQMISALTVRIGDQDFSQQPAILFDDVHDLADEQRRDLYEVLLDRKLSVGRWIAERYSALREDELLADASPDGRDIEIIRVEHAMISSSSGARTRSLDRVFGDIANARSMLPLSLAGYEGQVFTTFVDDRDSLDLLSLSDTVSSLQSRVAELCDEKPQYRGWLNEVLLSEPDSLLESAIQWRELMVWISRDSSKAAQTLFEAEPPEKPFMSLTNSGTRGAARLFLAKEYRHPYYAGPTVLAQLASRNVEQYLGLAGDFFDLMLAAIAIRRPPTLQPNEQDRRVRSASRSLWSAIPERVPHGSDVSALLHAIAANGKAETFRANAPYAPGVTGTAFRWTDRRMLLDALKIPGSDLGRVARAFSSAIAHNLLEVDQQVRGREGNWIVLYLNRLLCPFFDLPLQRGGYREQSLRTFSGWLVKGVDAQRSNRVPDPEQSLFDLPTTR